MKFNNNYSIQQFNDFTTFINYFSIFINNKIVSISIAQSIFVDININS